MKFTSILKNILVEEADKNKFEFLLDALTKPTTDKEGKKQKPKLTKDEFFKLVAADPDSNLSNVDLESAEPSDYGKVKAGKYVKWLVKNYLNPTVEVDKDHPQYSSQVKQAREVFMEDLYKTTQDLKKFDRFKARIPQEYRQIDKLTPEMLYGLVKDFSLEKTKASKEEKEKAKETYEFPGGEVVFKGNDWTIVKISDASEKGREAACYYGGYHLEAGKGETRWCTSSPSYTNWFYNYIKKGPLYVIIPSSWTGKRGEKSGLPATRYQFHFQDNQFMDVHDHQIDLIKFLNGEGSELKDFFKPEFATNLTVGDGKTLKITSFNSGAIGKYIALYGLSELFNNLPDDITDIVIHNNDQNNQVQLDLPDMSRFKKLKMLSLEKCINSIPDSLCECKELNFVNLRYNQNLKTIPDCIIDLPKLIFINLYDTQVVPPERIKERASEMNKNVWDFSEF